MQRRLIRSQCNDTYFTNCASTTWHTPSGVNQRTHGRGATSTVTQQTERANDPRTERKRANHTQGAHYSSAWATRRRGRRRGRRGGEGCDVRGGDAGGFVDCAWKEDGGREGEGGGDEGGGDDGSDGGGCGGGGRVVRAPASSGKRGQWDSKCSFAGGTGRVAAAHMSAVLSTYLPIKYAASRSRGAQSPMRGWEGFEEANVASSCARNLILRQMRQTGREGEMQSAEGSGRLSHTICRHIEY
eukprot:6370771-Prymnesium_polylepis.1